MLTRTQEQKNLYKVLILLIKYSPPISTLLLTFHATLCVHGFKDPLLDNIADLPLMGLLFMVVSSYAFWFCKLHRISVLFNFIVNSVIKFDIEIGLGVFQYPCQFFTALIGTSILTLYVEHWKGFIECNNAKDDYIGITRED